MADHPTENIVASWFDEMERHNPGMMAMLEETKIVWRGYLNHYCFELHFGGRVLPEMVKPKNIPHFLEELQNRLNGNTELKQKINKSFH